MCDETSVPAESEPLLNTQPSLRQQIEFVMDRLRQEDTPDRQLAERLSKLSAALEQHLTAPETVAAYEDAVERAPWLTAERERLRDRQTTLRHSLQAIASRLRHDGSTASTRQLFQQMQDLAELYVEYDAAEQDFFEQAYPGPDWVL